MKKRFMNLLPGLVTMFAFTTASIPPQQAEAATTTKFSQVILAPDCYDFVNVTGNTIDYIATFDCEYRRPDGTPVNETTMYLEGTLPPVSMR